MKLVIDIPDFDGNGLDVIWEKGSNYRVSIEAKSVVFSANKAALISLAKQMIYLAYNDIPAGSHIHYDSFFTKTTRKVLKS